jgi:hypothetical protein
VPTEGFYDASVARAGLAGTPVSALAKYLSLTLYIGSAYRSADANQHKRLTAELQPNLDQLKKAGPNDQLLVRNAILGLVTTVHEVMGPEWTVDGKTAEFIAKLKD